jgi:hypothetical protein
MTILVWKPVTWDTHILGNLHIDISPADIPSGKHTKNYGKSHFSMGKLTISMAIFSSKLLNYQRVIVFP